MIPICHTVVKPACQEPRSQLAWRLVIAGNGATEPQWLPCPQRLRFDVYSKTNNHNNHRINQNNIIIVCYSFPIL
jgi:hypothetical protein